MNREDFEDELIDLGAVSEETKGPAVGHDDQNGGLILPLGLSDE